MFDWMWTWRNRPNLEFGGIFYSSIFSRKCRRYIFSFYSYLHTRIGPKITERNYQFWDIWEAIFIIWNSGTIWIQYYFTWERGGSGGSMENNSFSKCSSSFIANNFNSDKIYSLVSTFININKKVLISKISDCIIS